MERKNKKLPTGSNVVLPDIQIMDGEENLTDPYHFFDQQLKTRYLARRMGLDERTLKSHLEKAGIEVRRGEFKANELLNLVKVIAISKDRRVAVNKAGGRGEDGDSDYQLEDYVQGGWVHCNKPMLMIQFQEAMKKTLENRESMRELMEIDNCIDLVKELVASAVVVLDETLINTLRSGDTDKIELVQEVTAEIRKALGDKLIEAVTSFERRSNSLDLAELYNITETGNDQPNTEDNE